MSRASRLLPILAAALAGGALALVIAGSGGSRSVTTTEVLPAHQAALPTSFGAGRGLTVNQIGRAARPGVVDITVTSTSNGGADPTFGGAPQQTVGEGAGVVYDTKGTVLTDEHVVAGATSVRVKFQDGKVFSARVLGSDPSTDVGVIRVNAPASELHPLTLADSSAAQVGDNVVAIGSPFGLPGTVTAGIVSAVNRSIKAPNMYTITGAIQTDAAINQGNSGGPLLDASGRVLGLNDQIETNSGSSAGVGFAVPSNTVARVAQQIIAGHVVKHSYVGIQLGASGPATVKAVAAGGPGAGAGLQPGDVITSIDGKGVSSTDQFISTIDGYQPAATVTLGIRRGGGTVQIKVKLGTRPH